MKITFNIPDDLLPCVTQFVTKHFPDNDAPRFDDKSGAMLPAVPKWTSEEYFEMVFTETMLRITQEFKTPAMQAEQDQIDALQRQQRERAKVVREK